MEIKSLPKPPSDGAIRAGFRRRGIASHKTNFLKSKTEIEITNGGKK